MRCDAQSAPISLHFMPRPFRCRSWKKISNNRRPNLLQTLFLEALFLGRRKGARPDIAGHDHQRFERSETTERVDLVVTGNRRTCLYSGCATASIEPGKSSPSMFVHHSSDKRHFAEKTMAPDIETVSLVLYRSGNASDDAVLLEHDCVGPILRQLVSSGESSWTCSNDDALWPLMNLTSWSSASRVEDFMG